MPQDLANVNTPNVAELGRGAGNIMNMAAAQHHVQVGSKDKSRIQRRLRRLIEHLDMSQSQFAARIGYSPGHITRMLSATRGKGMRQERLFLQIARAFGIEERYWTSPVDLDPSACFNAQLKEGEPMASIVGPQTPVAQRSAADIRLELARWAAEEDGAPAELVKEIVTGDLPGDPSPMGVLRHYSALKKRVTAVQPKR